MWRVKLDKIGINVTDKGCHIPIGHKFNRDGYCRVVDPRRKLKNNKNARVFLHRLVWEEANGLVPKGYSLHHTCTNRACCNIEHLQLMTKKEHAALHNSTRYNTRLMLAKEYWRTYKPTGTALASLFGVDVSTGCKWIRDWKDEK